jgi:glutamate--cysteine ligase
MSRDGETLSLEPGGQFELSGRPFGTAREAAAENLHHLAELKQVSASLGLRVVTLGYRPFGTLEAMPWMPKTRYRTMRESLGERGRLAHHMMLMTATGQASYDWRDEADCARKTVAAAKVAPLLVALYANSPLVNGELSGFLSWRSRVWNEVDPARCGYPTCMLDGSFSYATYVDWAIDAPVLFLRREGQYLQPRRTFRQLLASGWNGQPLTLNDWTDHLSTLFPEVRLKKVIEIRSADCVNGALTNALAALMRGLLYDETALDEVTHLLPPLSPREHLELHAAAQVRGLAAKAGSGTLADYAIEAVEIGVRGLKRLDPADVVLLEPLRQVAESRRSPALDVVAHWEKEKRPEVFLERFAI